MKKFKRWFEKTYGCKAPDELINYLKDNPEGSCGTSGSLYGIEDMIDYTEDRNLQEKGVMYLGTGDFLNVFLLRAKDGKVFLVDKTDHQVVDAWFKDLQMCLNLLDLQQ